MKKSDTPKIFIHCSASSWGSADVFREWHTAPKESGGRGWSDIGYHYVILNPFPNYKSKKENKPQHTDGIIENGRPLDSDDVIEAHERGAHVKGFNTGTLGVCLVGNETFTVNQIEAAVKHVNRLLLRFGFNVADVWGHYEADDKKTCPNLNMDVFRDILAKYNKGHLQNVRRLQATINQKFLDVLK